MRCHEQLTDSIEDQLSLASIHYQRSHCQVLIATTNHPMPKASSWHCWPTSVQILDVQQLCTSP